MFTSKSASQDSGCNHGQHDLSQRVAETLPEEVLAKMHAPPKPDIPVVTPATSRTTMLFSLAFPLVMVTSQHNGRPSGTPLVNSGLVESTGANTLVPSSLPEVLEVDRKAPILQPCQRLPTTA